ncbi:putative Heterokaryon incompatibility domain-containing protein [Seiridium unicorne]|uniref:Heterokaryon incompatibility domain-containing protein n=1 Tax=Seiridium unicorne TaxID=138068 RepID=A0ABR2UIW9_9PEZI
MDYLDLSRDDGPSRTEDEKQLFCNGQKMTILPNLYDALVELRSSCPGDYWIDAVCINQLDSDERTSQVGMMGHIYQQAESVTVWLDTCPPLLSATLQKKFAKIQLTSSRPEKQEDIISMSFLTLLWVFSRRWFKRLWTVQEVCLARRRVFRVGKLTTSPEVMLRLVNEFQSHCQFLDYATRTASTTHIQNIPLVLGFRQTLEKGEKWSLDEWLNAVKGRRLKVARDIVYGGLALVDPECLCIDQSLQLKHSPPRLSHRPRHHFMATVPQQVQQDSKPEEGEQNERPPLPIRPAHSSLVPIPLEEQRESNANINKLNLWPKITANYRASTAEVFLNVAAALLSRPNGVDLLFSTQSLFRGRGLRFQNLNFVASDETLDENNPSWIPNPIFWSFRKKQLIWRGEQGYSACTQYTNNPKISPNGRVLYIEATKLEIVEHLLTDGVPCSAGSNVIRMFGYFHHVIQGFSTYCTQLNIRPEENLARLASVIVAGRMSDTDALFAMCAWIHASTLSPEESDWSSSPFATIHKRLSLELKLEPDPKAVCASFARLKDAYPEAPWPKTRNCALEDERLLACLTSFFKLFFEMADSWSIFTTAKGRPCLALQPIQRGDQVMLVKGSQVPYVFRLIDEDLKRRANAIKTYVMTESAKNYADEVKIRQRDEIIEKLTTELKGIEARIGKENGWVLVGEAFVEGVMHGEALDQDLEFETVDVV